MYLNKRCFVISSQTCTSAFRVITICTRILSEALFCSHGIRMEGLVHDRLTICDTPKRVNITIVHIIKIFLRIVHTLKYCRSEVSTTDHDDRPFGLSAAIQCLSNHLGVFFGNVLKRNCISPDLASTEHAKRL